MTTLGIAAIFKDEAKYLEEWVLFHRAQGFERFYLFDDGSSDGHLEVLKQFIDDGTVTLAAAPNQQNFYRRQVGSYEAALRMARNECDWLAFLDIDEFLFSPEGSIRQALPNGRFVAAVFVWWHFFGSSGHEYPPSRGVVESYVMCAPFPQTLFDARNILRHNGNLSWNPPEAGTLNGKSIVRPKRILRAGIHAPSKYLGNVVDEHGRRVFWSNFVARIFPKFAQKTRAWFWVPTQEKLRLNHYWSKSIAELETKAARSRSFQRPQTLADYLERDRAFNQIEDLTILASLS